MDINEIEQLVKILSRSDVTDFELEREGVRLNLRRAGADAPFQPGGSKGGVEPAIASVPPASGSGPSGPPKEAVPDHLVKVVSPIVGTFYRKPSPDADVFVKEGDRVKKGDTLCIVEAMKLMNEIESPTSGRIEKIFLGDGHVVEFGEVLFLIDPD